MVGGALLGAVSRYEEASPGFGIGVSTSTTWLAAAFVAGLAGTTRDNSAGYGALTLSCANAAYYLRGIYGPVEKWLVLGVAGGAVFGWLGGVCRNSTPPWRQLASLVLLGVAVFEVLGISTRVLGPAIP